jgi:hypothetical protein
MNTDEFTRLWTSEKRDYIIVRLGKPRDLSTHAIVNRATQSAVLIEDEELMVEVIRRMMDAGVPVVDRFPEQGDSSAGS